MAPFQSPFVQFQLATLTPSLVCGAEQRGSPFNLVGTWVSATPPHQPSTLLPAGQEGGGGKKKHSAFLYTNMVPNHFWSAFAICLIGVGRLSYSWVNMHMFCPYKHTSFCQPAKHIVDYKLTSEPCWQWGSQMNNLSLMVLLQIIFWIFHLFSFKTPRSG